MAYADSVFSPRSLAHALALPFVGLSSLMHRMSHAAAQAKAAQRILDMSDQDLAKQGKTRAQAIQAVFSDNPF